jgi:hydroxymethylbilane synthase
MFTIRRASLRLFMATESLCRAGTRGSPLALWQTDHVLHLLRDQRPQVSFERQVIKTQGDRILDIPLAQIGDKGLFTKELEVALLAGQIDFAVHSYKDLPTQMPDGLVIGAIIARQNPHDAFVSRKYAALADVPKGACIGTGSLRRQIQLAKLRPDLTFKDLRGNIGTRLEKLHRGDYDAIIMACAALERLGLSAEITEELPYPVMLPAVAQGAIAIECRAEDTQTLKLLATIHHAPTALQVSAEREFLRALGGGCEHPIAAHALVHGSTLTLWGYVARADGSESMLKHREAESHQAAQLGRDLAADMLAAGASGWLI